MIYPWQQQNWKQLLARYRNHNLPHASLFTGVPGLGKFVLATNFAKFLLCENNAHNDYPCETCKSCSLFMVDNHPDFLLVQPEEAGRAIKVEQIRQMIEEVSSTAHQGGMRIVVINVADAMNIAAANALLKTLEEPSGDVIIILVSSRPSALPATITSRCQKMEFISPPFNSVLHWLRQENVVVNEADAMIALNLTHNAPLRALTLLQSDDLTLRQKIVTELLAACHEKNPQMDAVTFATTYADMDSIFLVQLFLSIVSDLLKLQLAIVPEFATNLAKAQELRDVCKYFSAEKLLEYQTYLLELGKVISNNVVLNKQLLLENLWLRLRAARCY